MLSAAAMAQGGLSGLYIDPWGNECDFDDNGFGIIDVLVVHKFAPEAGAVEFMVRTSPGFTGTYPGEEIMIPNGAKCGNSYSGISFAYGECLSSPIHILTIRYVLYGTSAPLSYLKVVADSHAHPPGIYMVDCNRPYPNLLPALGGRACINNDGTVNCTTTPEQVTPTQVPTWGGIKALYAE
jgi:hypothetical protein